MKNSRPPARRTISSNKYTLPTRNIVKNSSQQEINIGKDLCDICAQLVPGPEREKIFAFGECDHRVCYVCSARLRVICDQSECPICRKKLDNVIFTSDTDQSFDKFRLKDCLYNTKYKIYFDNKSVKDAFDNLLKYECQECLKGNKYAANRRANNKQSNRNISNKPGMNKENSLTPRSANSPNPSKNSHVKSDEESPNQGTAPDSSSTKTLTQADESAEAADLIQEDGQGLIKSQDLVSHSIYPDVFGLTNHLYYVHKLKLCDLCLTHNKLFPYEYSYYNVNALKLHIREGEPRTSHRGHPNCELCHNTFFNFDELMQHMSREHYHCHLCGRLDSNMRIYFLDYDSLRNHFKSKHFLCERGNCRYEQFTSAFDTTFEYQLHLKQVHGSAVGLSRSEARQRCTITLDSISHRARPLSPTRSMRQNPPANSVVMTTGTLATANNPRQTRPEVIHPQIIQQRIPSRADFPSLSHGPDSYGVLVTNQPATGSHTTAYPHLASTSSAQAANSTNAITGDSATMSQRVTAGPSSSKGSFVRTLAGHSRQMGAINEMDFPPLPEQPKSKKANNNKKPKSKQETPKPKLKQPTGNLTFEEYLSRALTINDAATARKMASKKSSSNVSKKSRGFKIEL